MTEPDRATLKRRLEELSKTINAPSKTSKPLPSETPVLVASSQRGKSGNKSWVNPALSAAGTTNNSIASAPNPPKPPPALNKGKSLVWTRPGAPPLLPPKPLPAPAFGQTKAYPAAAAYKPAANSSHGKGQACHRKGSWSEIRPSSRKPSAKPSAREYLYGSVYERSADGFTLVRTKPAYEIADSTSVTASNTANRSGSHAPIASDPSAPRSRAVAPSSSSSKTLTKEWVRPQGVSGDTGVSSQSNNTLLSTTAGSVKKESSSSAPNEASFEEDSEARLKKARLYIAASGHIARALGKQSEAEKLAAEKVLAAQAKARLKATEKQKAAQPPAPRGPCTFFVRTGECARGAACRYAHHPNQVGLCPAFLRGVRVQAGKSAAGVGASADAATGGNGSSSAESMAIGCSRGDACPMSHDVSDADRMPPCPAFLRGNCVDLHCPLRHVKINRSAAPCPEFLQNGACPRGADCPFKHPPAGLGMGKGKGIAGRKN